MKVGSPMFFITLQETFHHFIGLTFCLTAQTKSSGGQDYYREVNQRQVEMKKIRNNHVMQCTFGPVHNEMEHWIYPRNKVMFSTKESTTKWTKQQQEKVNQINISDLSRQAWIWSWKILGLDSTINSCFPFCFVKKMNEQGKEPWCRVSDEIKYRTLLILIISLAH